MFLESETESTSSDYEEGPVLSRTNSNSSNKIWDSDDSCTDQDVELKMGKRLGKLYCQHFEDTSPYNRLPFRDMVSGYLEIRLTTALGLIILDFFFIFFNFIED